MSEPTQKTTAGGYPATADDPDAFDREDAAPEETGRGRSAQGAGQGRAEGAPDVTGEGNPEAEGKSSHHYG